MKYKNKKAAGGNHTAYLFSLVKRKIMQEECQEALLGLIKNYGDLGVKLSELRRMRTMRPFSEIQVEQALEELASQKQIRAEKRYPEKGRPSIWVLVV